MGGSLCLKKDPTRDLAEYLSGLYGNQLAISGIRPDTGYIFSAGYPNSLKSGASLILVCSPMLLCCVEPLHFDPPASQENGSGHSSLSLVKKNNIPLKKVKIVDKFVIN